MSRCRLRDTDCFRARQRDVKRGGYGPQELGLVFRDAFVVVNHLLQRFEQPFLLSRLQPIQYPQCPVQLDGPIARALIWHRGTKTKASHPGLVSRARLPFIPGPELRDHRQHGMH